MNLNKLSVTFNLALIAGIVIMVQMFESCTSSSPTANNIDTSSTYLKDLFGETNAWKTPVITSIPKGEEGNLISYGRTLVIHTSKYFGPQGTISHSSNGMNCQNCHLDAGTRPFGNNLGAVAAIYPKFSPRSGNNISIADKVNECLTRSMNGSPIDTSGREMKAYVAYIKWLGKDVTKGVVPEGSGGIKAPHFINRAADPEKGKIAFEQLCARCHGKDGQGQFAADVLKDPAKQQGGNATTEDLYYYPPLWGEHSFNGVATLYRLSKFAGFIKDNMPYPLNHDSRILTDQQAWDIAAYVNSQQRPVKDHSKDYSGDVSKKPYDFPFGPYADKFTEEQHKYGPYAEMPSAMSGH